MLSAVARRSLAHSTRSALPGAMRWVRLESTTATPPPTPEPSKKKAGTSSSETAIPQKEAIDGLPTSQPAITPAATPAALATPAAVATTSAVDNHSSVTASAPLASKLASAPTTLSLKSSKSTSNTPPVIVPKPIRRIVPDPEERHWHETVVNGRGSLSPYRHPQTYGIPVAIIHFRSYFPSQLALFTHFVSHAASSLGIPISGVASLPTQRSMWTRAIKAFDADQEVVDRWVKYMERHAMPGVGLRVVRWHRVPISVGKKQLESVMGQMRLGGITDKQKMKALGKQIVKEEAKAVQDVLP
ncbi:hypothetical protein EW146_g8224 [Bondarzewia mesenterica]|uniref:Small ribosomal subunit protein uS10 domain-containing protein n=1 Tax=Bondarzewia mesenterica TaxID=1095465 RepID=A0A4S4LG53_9AGAM|nr:hypothetical protein EW146_g8224 [Bondarzewia mesenterica]